MRCTPTPGATGAWPSWAGVAGVSSRTLQRQFRIFLGKVPGAATAAFGAGLSRTALATYLPAFFTAGALCVVAALITLAIARHPKQVTAC